MNVAYRAWVPLALLLASVTSPEGGHAAPPSSALSLAQQTSERMLDAMRDRREELKQHPERIYGLVEEIVLPHFDFERMSRLVLGRYWRSATPEQQKRFVEEFRNLLVRTYATALLDYSDYTISFAPVRAPANATDIIVRSEVQQPGGLPVPIDYRMYAQGDTWKVYDVIVDGVSLLTNYRTSFGNEVRQSGLDRLIDRLAERNRRGK
jgi:phospholipid transport system substrate-binding protein